MGITGDRGDRPRRKRFTPAEVAEMDKVTRQATVDHGGVIEALLTEALPSLPKLAQSLVRLSAKKVTFAGTRSMGDLVNAFFILVALDQRAIAYPIAMRLASIPKFNSGRSEPLISIVHRAYWYAHQIQDQAAIDALAPHLFVPEGYRPVLDGSLLRHPLDRSPLRGHLDLDPDDKSDVYTPIGRPQYFVRDLSWLSVMWGYGGTNEWPRERLEVERERLETALRAIPGMH